jgi:hypothetical protein|tara:strand:+ start:607 stop:747 length:141 start_codon:yes stop_codon:yes gene_type:complete
VHALFEKIEALTLSAEMTDRKKVASASLATAEYHIRDSQKKGMPRG